jgi:hypothetical protein
MSDPHLTCSTAEFEEVSITFWFDSGLPSLQVNRMCKNSPTGSLLDIAETLEPSKMSMGSFVMGLSALFAVIHVFEHHISQLAQRSLLKADCREWLLPPPIG